MFGVRLSIHTHNKRLLTYLLTYMEMWLWTTAFCRLRLWRNGILSYVIFTEQRKFTLQRQNGETATEWWKLETAPHSNCVGTVSFAYVYDINTNSKHYSTSGLWLRSKRV